MTPGTHLPRHDLQTPLASVELISLEEVADMMASLDDPGRRHGDWHPDYPREDDRDAVGGVREIDGWGPRRIRRRSDGLVVGSIGFFGAPDEVDGVLETEVGYGLVEAARGRRLMSQVLPAMLALTDAAGVQVRAGTTHDNAASLAVLSSVGFSVLDGRDATPDPEREVHLVRLPAR